MANADLSFAKSAAADRLTTCLGCGCLCDDLRVRIVDGRIVATENACAKGVAWLGDGIASSVVRSKSAVIGLKDALSAAADLLFAHPGRLLVYVAGDLTCEVHREATALADRVGASIDGLAADTVAAGIMASQRHGRTSATLGELRHRAETVIFWGVDPAQCWPRFLDRFLTSDPTLPPRTFIAVDIGRNRGPASCGQRLSLEHDNEVDALRVMLATVLGRSTGPLAKPLSEAAALATQLTATAGYVAVVFDAEQSPARLGDVDRAEGLIALTQAMNGSTREALIALRDGGNRNGFESQLTWQTGYPFAVDFASGRPDYVANESVATRIDRGRYTSALVLGSPPTVPGAVVEALRRIPTVAIGPKSDDATFNPQIVIETGTASIHEGGLVVRMDDVPLQVEPLISHPLSATEIVRQLAALAPPRRSEVR